MLSCLQVGKSDGLFEPFWDQLIIKYVLNFVYVVFGSMLLYYVLIDHELR